MCKGQTANGTGGDSIAHHTLVLISNCGELRRSGDLDQLEEWADGNLLRFNTNKMRSPKGTMV